MIARLTLLLVGLCCLVQPSLAGTLSWISHERWVSVKSVADGDTFTTVKGEKVRLLGINTPETRKDTKPAQPFGNAAKQALKRLIAGKQVRLTFDKEKKDRYGRTLAHVYTRDGLWVNAELLKQGLAHVYTFAPNTKFAQQLTVIEQGAIQQKRGIWAHKRWKVLDASKLTPALLGQFRLIQGVVSRVDHKGWRIHLGKLKVSVPRKYRGEFKHPPAWALGDTVLVRGRLRLSQRNQWFLSIHSKSDVYHIQ